VVAIAPQNVPERLRHRYAGRGQLTVLSTVLVFDLTGSHTITSKSISTSCGTGDVIDVEFILGESVAPKVSERLMVHDQGAAAKPV
jgi:hypothetical protein